MEICVQNNLHKVCLIVQYLPTFAPEFQSTTKVMKKILTLILLAVTFVLPSFSQAGSNDKADSIVGEYLTDRGGKKSKVRVTKEKNGTYTAQVFWVEQPLDANGKKRKDVKNPDEKLRNVDIDKVVIVRGLKYDKDDKEWGDAKIYDPSKGIRVNVTAEFVSPKKLKLRGTILGIGTTIYWTKLK
jgi:uncharacterized protein (DUF2147 family)